MPGGGNTPEGRAAYAAWYRTTPNGRAARARANEKYYRSEKGRESHKRALATYEARFAERLAAHRAVTVAVAGGRLVRPSECQSCGVTGRIDAHHHNGYALSCWLDVVWLCRPCHRVAHPYQRSLAKAA